MLRFSKHVQYVSHQKGVTLVEMIIAIVIISIAAVALLQGLGSQTTRNVDPMIQSQAQTLAKQYMDEVLSKPFFDPLADPRLDPTISQANAVSSAADQTASTASATNRATFNNVFEYNGFSQPAQTLSGTAITNLAGFQIAISIDNSAGLQLGTLTNAAITCPPEVLLVTVTVTDARNQTTGLQGYRTSYFDAPWAGC